ncbi:MAG TPA: glycoside hydrolase family 2 protein [Bacteroidota bacterium]|nr:glycoside hydrolase family 2 protein [Bacteroidota bacterium]
MRTVISRLALTLVTALIIIPSAAWRASAGSPDVRSASLGKRENPFVIDLSGLWRMKDYSPGVGITKGVNLPSHEPKDCLPYRVPGTVRAALLEAGEIPDPYNGFENEKSLWTEQKEWWFFKTFSLPANLKARYIDLVFEGASFRGEVWMNGHMVGELKGMLNPRAFNVAGLLKFGGENSLAVRLEATPDARESVMAHGLTWDTPRDQLFSIAQCMYGWDWGPHGVPIGLWRPVMLRLSGPLRIDHPYVRVQMPKEGSADCHITMDVHNETDKTQEGSLQGVILEKETRTQAAEFHAGVTLAPHESKEVGVDLRIENPRLWWPNGMGDQNLYLLRASIVAGSEQSEALTEQFGIRELKLVENENVGEFLKSMKDDVGSPYRLGKAVGSYPWTFQVNGKKMFAKGANWIPIDQLLRLDHRRYERLLRLAKEAHFNLLRVWGGGLYETDDFYRLCDELGILAWQEFLSNRSFSKIDRENFLEGASSAVVRLRNHPSLTFWCGGNEFDPDDAGSKAVVDALGATLKALDPDREFHRASPYMGDDHHWGVWHDGQPYTAYRVVRPFRSEAGLNTFPVPEDYRKFTPPEELWPPDTVEVEYHGEYNTGFQHVRKLQRYVNEFGAAGSIDEMIAKSELYQALANEFNMEFCRANKFRNSGLLIWQYDDIWPCISWSLVDWYGMPKPSYYFQKRASRPVHISADYERYLWKTGETFSADVHLLNDTALPVEHCTFHAKLLDVAGGVLVSKAGAARVDANQSATVGRIEYPISQGMAGKTMFVSVELIGEDSSMVSSALYPIAVSKSGNLAEYSGIFEQMKDLPPVDLAVDVPEKPAREDAHGRFTTSVRLTNPSNRLAFFVRLRLKEESDSLRAYFSDNYVSLLPRETTTVSLSSEDGRSGAVPAAIHFEITGWNCSGRTVEERLLRP